MTAPITSRLLKSVFTAIPSPPYLPGNENDYRLPHLTPALGSCGWNISQYS